MLTIRTFLAVVKERMAKREETKKVAVAVVVVVVAGIKRKRQNDNRMKHTL